MRLICSDHLRQGRPDRGPEEPCPYPATWRIEASPETKYVCGYHARAYVPSVRSPFKQPKQETEA